jgi:hypothetical protein
LVVANPIYQEVIPRVLANAPQDSLPIIAPTWLTPDGKLHRASVLAESLAAFQATLEEMIAKTMEPPQS